MSINYSDDLPVSHTFEEEAGDTGGTTRPVHGLPDDVKAALQAVKVATEALAAIIAASKLAVLDSTVNTTLGTTNTTLSTISGNVDTLEAKLQSIIDAVGVPSGGPKTGYVGSIGSGADVDFSTQALSQGFYIKNVSASLQVLYYGVSAAPSSTTAPSLQPGEVSPFIPAANVTAVHLRASASGGAAAYVGA